MWAFGRTKTVNEILHLTGVAQGAKVVPIR